MSSSVFQTRLVASLIFVPVSASNASAFVSAKEFFRNHCQKTIIKKGIISRKYDKNISIQIKTNDLFEGGCDDTCRQYLIHYKISFIEADVAPIEIGKHGNRQSQLLHYRSKLVNTPGKYRFSKASRENKHCEIFNSMRDVLFRDKNIRIKKIWAKNCIKSKLVFKNEAKVKWLKNYDVIFSDTQYRIQRINEVIEEDGKIIAKLRAFFLRRIGQGLVDFCPKPFNDGLNVSKILRLDGRAR